MTGGNVSAQLTLSFAVEALRLLNEILSRLDIVADNGKEVLCAFPASYRLHDSLCAFMADAENDEDDGSAEDCGRTMLLGAADSMPTPKQPWVTGGSSLVTPRMIAGYSRPVAVG